jgi:hypothetical protein
MEEALSIQCHIGSRLASRAKIAAMIVLAGAFANHSSHAEAQTPTLMRFPNTFGEKIVFEAHDNLWLAWISVRRENVRSLSGRLTHPATVAPAGSNRSGRGGDEAIRAFGVEGHFRWLGDHAGRNE